MRSLPVARVRTLVVALLLVALAAPAPAGASTRGADLGLADGASWVHARLDVDAAPCLEFTLAGILERTGEGQAVLLDVPTVGHLGVYFSGGDTLSVRASVNVSLVRAHVEERVGPADGTRAFSYAFRACHPPDGVAYAGAFDAWALHTDGVRDAVTRVDASAGAIDVTRVDAGERVRFRSVQSFGDGAAVATSTSFGGGASGVLVMQERATTTGPVFGALVHFDLVEDYELHGPDGAHAWKRATGSGGSVDPGAFHGPAGTWLAKVRTSVSPFSAPRAFFVLADTSG